MKTIKILKEKIVSTKEDHIEIQIKSENSEIIFLYERIQELEKEVKYLNGTVEDLEREIEDLNETIDDLEDDKTDFENEICELENTFYQPKNLRERLLTDYFIQIMERVPYEKIEASFENLLPSYEKI